ncbi:MAG: tRNA-intron lyase [Candidatus Aenigmatarchaeota archaeon]
MLNGTFEKNKVIVEGEGIKNLFNNGWYGNIENNKLILDLFEAAFLLERGKIEIFKDNEKIKIDEFFGICCNLDKSFMYKYSVYSDLRNRGLTVRAGYIGTDFKVYERGAKPNKNEKIKWIVFVSSEEYPCILEQLGKAIKLSQNIRATAVWAVVDTDLDVTYYIINSIIP